MFVLATLLGRLPNISYTGCFDVEAPDFFQQEVPILAAFVTFFLHINVFDFGYSWHI